VKRFVFTNSGDTALLIKESFPEGHWQKHVVPPGETKVIALWGEKRVEVTADVPDAPSQGDVYGRRG
jgi:hypothetical protein